MPAREIWVKIGANIQGLQAGVAKAQQAIMDFDRELQKNAAKRRGIEELGTAFGKLGALSAAGLGVSIKAAMDWETAWAGVTKTVDGTEQQLSVLHDELREMARTMPATHAEIAAVAQAAGALGVETPNVAEFTRTMIMLAEATDDLTADQAATNMQQIMNVMKTSADDVDNLANALVRLGNNGASTEGQILEMAARIAGAGATIGLTEADVFGLANALASAGIEAQAGGSAVSRILIDMAKAAKGGGDDLAAWAKAAGLTADAFKTLMADDPARAFQKLTENLAKINNEGGNVFEVMEDLGQNDVNVTRALLNMANAGDMLGDSLDDAADAFANGSDMADEYAKRAETSAAKAQVAWNGIKDAMIEVGQAALPVVKELAESVAELTGWFSDLPDSVQGGVTEFLALAAVLGGAVWAVSKVRTGFAEFADSLERSGTAAEGMGRKMALMRGGATLGGLGLLAFSDALGEVDTALGNTAEVLGGAAVGFGVGGPWGAAIGGGISLIKAFADANRVAIPDIDAFTEALDRQTGELSQNNIEMVKRKLRENDAFAKGKKVGISGGTLMDAALGDPAALAEVERIQKEYLDRVAPILEGKGPYGAPRRDAAALSEASSDITELNKILDAQNGLVAEARRNWEAETEALAQSRVAHKLTAEQITALSKAVEGIPKAAITEFTQPGYEDALANIINIAHEYDLTPEQVQTAMETLDYASEDIALVQEALDKFDGDVATATVYVRSRGIEAVTAAIGAIPGVGKPISALINVVRRYQNQTSEADGGVLDFYAGGGFSENHVAQIAPAGSWRVWAEPETGGEAYIPLAASKRQRSLEIWAETGRRLGAFANGGLLGGLGGPVTATLTGAQVAIDPRSNIATFVKGEVQLAIGEHDRQRTRNFQLQMREG